MNDIKILYFTHYTDLYGANKSLIEIVKNLKLKGIEPIVITPNNGEINKELDTLKIENYSFKYDCWVSSADNNTLKNILLYIRYKIKNFIAIKKICKKFHNYNINLIHSNSSVIDIGAKVANKIKVKHFWHIREFGLEDYNIRFFKKRDNAIKYMINKSDRIICISDSIRKSYFKYIDNSKIKVIYNAVDIKNKKNIKKKYDKFNIVIAGTIIESKNQLELLKAYMLIDNRIRENITIDIIGGGNESYINNIKKFIKANKIEKNVNILGYVKDINNLYKNYNLGIVTSIKEGFGRVTVEYMMNAIIPIVSDSGANKELILNGENGYVYKLNDINNLADIISKLYLNKENLYKISNQARIYSNERFNIDRLCNELMSLYIETNYIY